MGRNLRGGRLPLAIAVSLVLTLGALYYFYARNQRIYFSSRNLRLLATVAGQLEEALKTNEGFVRNYGASERTPKTYTRTVPVPDADRNTDRDPASFLPGFDSATRDCIGTTEAMPSTRPELRRALSWKGDEPLLTIGYAEVTARPPAVGGKAQAITDPCAAATFTRRQASAVKPLRSILDPIFSQSLLTAFDDVMLVRGDGMVMYIDHEHARGPLSSGNESESAAEQVVTSLDHLVTKRPFEDAKELDLAALRQASQIAEVETSTGAYYLFTQPFPYETVDADNGDASPEVRRWIIAGMVPTSRFRYEVMSVSTSIVLVVMALFVMMICAWPYLRISLIGAHQRLTIADVLLLGFAALIHAAILTLIVVDVLAYRSLRAVSDKELDLIGTRLEQGLTTNLQTAAASLRLLDEGMKPETWAGLDILSNQSDKIKLPNPYVSLAAWMDADGRQRYKMTMKEAVPLVNVAQRQYFRDAKAKRLLHLDDDPKNAFAVESVRSWSTGETQAVVAKPSNVPGLSVVSATVELVDITHPVLPPGFGFAIIDDSGQVLFHSEESRNNQENFFAETDWNRTVRSAVFAHTPVHTSVRYWGADHRVYVKPLERLPWTLIVFRNKSLLRTVNTEAIAMALSMLLGNSMIYLCVIFLILLWNPRYRAPHAWPLRENLEFYGALVVLYLVTIVSACFTMYAFDPRSVLLLTMLVPAQSFAGSIIILERRRMGYRCVAALVIWFATFLMWIGLVARSQAMRGTAMQNRPGWLIGISIGLLLLTAWVTLSGISFKKLDRKYFISAYLTAGVLLLVLGAVIPAAGFFKVASRLEIEGFVKYSQLVIADRAEQAIAGIEQATMRPDQMPPPKAEWTNDPFRVRWELAPVDKGDPHPGMDADQAWLPDVYRNVLPAYSEESVSLRQLHGTSKQSSLWQWWWKGDRITLEKAIPSDPSQPQAMKVESLVPLSFEEAWSSDEGWTSGRWTWLIVFVFAIAAVLSLLFLIVRFFAVKLFLVDIHEPLWLKPPPPLKPTLGDDVLLIHEEKTSVKKLTGAVELDFFDVTFEELAGEKAKASAWEDKLLEIDRAPEGKNVRILDFEHGITNPGVSMRKLQFLEHLLALPNRTVIMATTVTPNAFLALVTNADLRKRWTKVLESFVWVTEAQLEPAPPHSEAPPQFDNRQWLERETEQGGFLRGLRDELDPYLASADREQLRDEISERSTAYYAGLWASCSAAEKILLHQLAREGMMNGKDRRSVRRLLARGLVRRGPNLTIFNETFRLFVLAAAQRENVPFDEHEAPSAWDMIRVPLFVVIISTIILIFATQKDMLNLATGLVAALTTGLPAIVRLFGFFAERRTTAKAE